MEFEPPEEDDAPRAKDTGADDTRGRWKDAPSQVPSGLQSNTQELLKRAREGSNAVWQVFFDRYKDFLVYHIRVKMPEFARRQFDAEDILQSAFTAAWKNILRFEYQGEGSFRRYLRRIVLNHFLNELQKAESQGRHFSAEEDQFSDGHPEDTDAGATDPAKLYSHEEFLQHALDKVRELSEEDQELLGMRFYESMTWTDMGEVLSCDRETAKEHFLRALKRLQRRIDSDGSGG